MDNLSLVSALLALRSGLADLPPFEDRELRHLLKEKRHKALPERSVRIDLAIGLAGLFESLAARLRGFVGGLGVTHV